MDDISYQDRHYTLCTKSSALFFLACWKKWFQASQRVKSVQALWSLSFWVFNWTVRFTNQPLATSGFLSYLCTSWTNYPCAPMDIYGTWPLYYHVQVWQWNRGRRRIWDLTTGPGCTFIIRDLFSSEHDAIHRSIIESYNFLNRLLKKKQPKKTKPLGNFEKVSGVKSRHFKLEHWVSGLKYIMMQWQDVLEWTES